MPGQQFCRRRQRSFILKTDHEATPRPGIGQRNDAQAESLRQGCATSLGTTLMPRPERTTRNAASKPETSARQRSVRPLAAAALASIEVTALAAGNVT